MAQLHIPYRAIRWILDGALAGLILVAILGAVLGRIIPLTGRETLIIGGGSMEPAIHLGAAVVIEPVAPAAIAVGDIVSLRSGDGLTAIFTHRVTRVIARSDGIWIETKGDANGSVDPSITPAADVIGRVVLNVPDGGFLLKLLTVPSGIALMLCLAGLLVTGAWLVESMEMERRHVGRPVPADPPAPRAVGRGVADGPRPPRAPERGRRQRHPATAGAKDTR